MVNRGHNRAKFSQRNSDVGDTGLWLSHSVGALPQHLAKRALFFIRKVFSNEAETGLEYRTATKLFWLTGSECGRLQLESIASQLGDNERVVWLSVRVQGRTGRLL